MSVTTHIVEVIRQGIWASLTGGWYYEPNYSIFCNTVHVYVWLSLMLIPLILGIFASGELTVPIAAAYTAFIVVLFASIKLIISYFHMIFDTTDPIVVTRTINDSIDEMFRDSEQQPLDVEMIELRDMGYNMRGSERALDRRDASRDRDSTRDSASRRCQPGSLTGSRSVGRVTAASATSSRRVRIEEDREEEKASDVEEAKPMKVEPKRKSSAPVLFTENEEGSSMGEIVEGKRRNSVPNDIPLMDSIRETSVDKVQEVVQPTRRRPSRRRLSASSTGRRRNPRRAGSPAVFPGSLIQRESMESSRSVPSSVGWSPVVVSLRDMDRPTMSRQRYSADDDESGSDIKVEITKFLEELIDKHPETLEAIESVRMNRLGQRRMENARGSQEERGLFSLPEAMRNAAARSSMEGSQHHIANDHEDTTQGAVHSFQDEDGNWWTYTFDESGVGTAQPLGSGRAIMEMMSRGGEKRSELEVLPESMYDSTEEEEDETKHIPLTRRERALSSSSNESCTYMPPLPSSIFHAPSGQGASRAARSQQVVCFSNGARMRSRNEENDGWPMDQIEELMETNRENASSLTNQERAFLAQFDSASTSTRPSSRFRFLSDLAFAGTTQENNRRDVATPDFTTILRTSNTRKSYYYQMKMFPKAQKTFNLKLDRPSVDRLFDRNRYLFSLVFDVILAAFVSILASLIIMSDIYFDVSLIIFAIVVASSHFSLLKSVQPDASSPIHGFNWIVSYSRPFYFCVLASLLLCLHHFAGGNSSNELVPWNWNVFRLSMMSENSIILAFRDIMSTIILFLPVAFTMGWLPQINTLIHHIFEQIEMHIFGGTPSFGVVSSFIQLTKSLLVFGMLSFLCQLAYKFAPNSTQSPMFSIFMAVTIAVCYLMSRMSSNQQLAMVLFEVMTSPFRASRAEENVDVNANVEENEMKYRDEIPRMLRKTVAQRARYDVLFAAFLILFFFALHSTSLFTATQPYFTKIIVSICIGIGIINHYVYPQLRSHTPWRLVAQAILRSAEHQQFESPQAAKLMPFEIVHMWMVAIERNIIYPLMVCSILTENRWMLPLAWLVYPLICMRMVRGGFGQPQLMYVPIGFAFISTMFDLKMNVWGSDLSSWNLLPLIMLICVIIYPKLVELYLKINFVMAYVAPWQISWGSAFHAFAQPFSVPHSALIAIQTVLSSVISAPLNPFLGSSFFTASYVRPVKFWERDYNTKRADASTMRLASQIERGPMLDDSNLNAVFYEHLTRSLQKSLAGDLAMGRWSTSVQPGDCFILASYFLNCLVHIVEVGNGFVTFQLRGLELRGTYCHQREVEAICEDIRDGKGFCCCAPGALPGFLSLNTAWGLRWLAWEVVSGKYIIDGYSISDNSAVNLLQVHELRRLLVTLYVKCIIYYSSKSTKIQQWINDDAVKTAIQNVRENNRYTDLDSMFCTTNDEDYDSCEGGISRASFSDFYNTWIDYCLEKRDAERVEREEFVCFCYLLSLVARRSLGTAAFNRHSNAAESFLYGLHSLFKGDFRITCQRDEWVFSDMEILRCVVAPAVKMALKLHQDHFAHFEEFDDLESLFDVIEDHQENMFISHEQDPTWRRAILANTPSLLALRHVYDDGQDDYKIIMLNKMHLNMRVIKLNRECVRAFWAGQQQELIFLRNRNPERGSIQNARQVLRNMINSSADQPVGYPIYVSPLTTSHVESHAQIEKVFGPTFTYEGICKIGSRIWQGFLRHFDPSISNSVNQPAPTVAHHPAPTATGASLNRAEPKEEEDRSSQRRLSLQMENSVVEMTKEGAKVSVVPRRDLSEPTTSRALAKDEREMSIGAWIQIVDDEQIFKYLNEPLKSTGECLVVWPDEMIQQMSGRAHWLYQPTKGMCGRIVYTWHPNHPIRAKRSHVGDYIHLIAIPAMKNGLVPVAENGCRLLSPSESAMHGLFGTTTAEHLEFMNRVNDVLVLAKVIPGTLSSNSKLTKKSGTSTDST